jgi:hypothetical protein
VRPGVLEREREFSVGDKQVTLFGTLRATLKAINDTQTALTDQNTELLSQLNTSLTAATQSITTILLGSSGEEEDADIGLVGKVDEISSTLTDETSGIGKRIDDIRLAIDGNGNSELESLSRRIAALETAVEQLTSNAGGSGQQQTDPGIEHLLARQLYKQLAYTLIDEMLGVVRLPIGLENMAVGIILENYEEAANRGLVAYQRGCWQWWASHPGNELCGRVYVHAIRTRSVPSPNEPIESELASGPIVNANGHHYWRKAGNKTNSHYLTTGDSYHSYLTEGILEIMLKPITLQAEFTIALCKTDPSVTYTPDGALWGDGTEDHAQGAAKAKAIIDAIRQEVRDEANPMEYVHYTRYKPPSDEALDAGRTW